GDFHAWCEAARWLASMHGRLQTEVDRFEREIPLLKYDEDFYRLWMRRAQTFLTNSAQPDVGNKINWLAERYGRVIENLSSLPKTFLHGEFYASNVLVREAVKGWRVCPVDWEMAAVGPGLMDLSALAAGKWTEEEKRLMARAYFESLLPEGNPFSSKEEFFRAFSLCRLQIAVQWLGWFGRRRAYSGHAHDWLSEAMSLAEMLML
nr:aminoglycoside phosphotransferase family protein [Acidobacteriota bacterium]